MKCKASSSTNKASLQQEVEDKSKSEMKLNNTQNAAIAL